MSKMCQACGKTRTTGNNVSHSKRHTRRVFDANIQPTSIVVRGQKVRVKMCTRCIRNKGKIAAKVA